MFRVFFSFFQIHSDDVICWSTRMNNITTLFTFTPKTFQGFYNHVNIRKKKKNKQKQSPSINQCLADTSCPRFTNNFRRNVPTDRTYFTRINSVCRFHTDLRFVRRNTRLRTLSDVSQTSRNSHNRENVADRRTRYYRVIIIIIMIGNLKM